MTRARMLFHAHGGVISQRPKEGSAPTSTRCRSSTGKMKLKGWSFNFGIGPTRCHTVDPECSTRAGDCRRRAPGPNNSTLLTRDIPSNSNRFIYYPGFGFQRRRRAKPASFRLTGETDSGAHTHPTGQSAFGSAVHPYFSPRDRGERVGGSVKRGRHRPHSLGPDK